MAQPTGTGPAPGAPQAQPSAPAAPEATTAPASETAPDGEPTSGNPELDRFRTDNGRLRAQLKKMEADLEASRLTQMSEQEKAVAAAKAAGEDAYKGRYREAMVGQAVMAALIRKGVVAPDLALRAMDLGDVEFDLESGNVDTSLIESKVADVLKRYPMLAPASGPGVGNVNGGDQRRVDAARAIKGTGNDANETLRWALKGSD